jgi:outer membrane protein insertion porin family
VDGFLTYTLNQNKIDNMDASMSQAYKDQQGTTLVSSLNNYWVYEGRDNRIFTTDGWFVRPSVTLAGGPLGGDQSFYKFEFEAKHYHMVFDFGDQKEHVLSHRLKLGYVDHFGDSDEVSIFQHFYAGGMGSVRGFENGSLGPRDGGFEIGGRFQTVYNLEYSIPINQRSIRGIMFWDTGNVFSGITQFKAKELRSSVGFGLRLQIPALGQMPLALDFAKPIRSQDGDDEEVFSFNFGNFF